MSQPLFELFPVDASESAYRDFLAAREACSKARESVYAYRRPFSRQLEAPRDSDVYTLEEIRKISQGST